MGRGSRSGSRSSFSGGRSYRSSSRSTSRSSGPIYRGSSYGTRRHTHVYIGPRRHYYGGGGSSSISFKMMTIFVLSFFALCLAIGGFSCINEINYHKESIEIARMDYDFYQEMIEDAYEKPSELIVDGEVVNGYYDEAVKKWYVIYKLPGDFRSYETFSVYSQSQVNDYIQDGTIELATNKNRTESIDTYLKNVDFEDFSLYILAKSELSSSRTTLIVMLTIAGAMIVIVVLLALKKENKTQTATNGQEGNSSLTTESVKRCKYCGSAYKNDETECENCGAHLDR